MESGWKHFTAEELSCRGKCPNCTMSHDRMNNQFMTKIVEIREELGIPLVVSSGYRCPEYNDKVSGTGLNGPHTTGKAVDIAISGKEAYILVAEAIDKKIRRIGINQAGPHSQRFVHLDDTDTDYKPWIWTYK